MHYLPKSELSKFFRAAQAGNQMHHLAALCGFFLGTRVSQVLNLRGEDIFQRDGRWVVMIRPAKGGNTVVHPLHIDPTDSAFDMSPLIEIAKVKGLSLIFGGLERSNFNKALKRYAAAAGVHTMYGHSHVFRHSAAMVIFDATGRIGAVTSFLAHKSPSSAFVYLQENDSRMAQDAMDALQLA